jgi:hypothetical protein
LVEGGASSAKHTGAVNRTKKITAIERKACAARIGLEDELIRLKKPGK